uniref:Uncharacterized protein n=1 Tax=Anguilla anguilla TaxID=7936 RepID=A0A0E9W598_ANGAN
MHSSIGTMTHLLSKSKTLTDEYLSHDLPRYTHILTSILSISKYLPKPEKNGNALSQENNFSIALIIASSF